MPRIIGAVQNEIIFEDNISGDKLGMYYRMPTTRERQGYLDSAVRRTGNKVTMHHAEARMTYGGKILVGIREHDFMRMEDGRAVPMSSDPDSDDYYHEWKAEMESGCADLVMALAAHVFDGSPSLSRDEETAADENLAGE